MFRIHKYLIAGYCFCKSVSLGFLQSCSFSKQLLDINLMLIKAIQNLIQVARVIHFAPASFRQDVYILYEGLSRTSR